MEISKFLEILIIINITFSFVNGEKIDIFLNNSISFKFSGNKKFYVNSVKENNLPNYLKIQVDSLYSNDNNDNRFVISYYQQDSSFEERKQFSQSYSNSTFIWLTKKQINKNFYFSVECSNSSWSYNLTIYKKEYAELNLGEIYNYYVTEENKNMKFLIKVNISQYFNEIYYFSNKKVTIWSRCGKAISTIIEPHSYFSLKKDNYQAYLFIYYNNDENLKEYYLKVEGNIGDLINIGSLIFNEKNTCPIIFKDIGTEITGIFKKDIFESICFKFQNATSNSLNYFLYDFFLSSSGLNQSFLNIDNYTLS